MNESRQTTKYQCLTKYHCLNISLLWLLQTVHFVFSPLFLLPSWHWPHMENRPRASRGWGEVPLCFPSCAWWPYWFHRWHLHWWHQPDWDTLPQCRVEDPELLQDHGNGWCQHSYWQPSFLQPRRLRIWCPRHTFVKLHWLHRELRWSVLPPGQWGQWCSVAVASSKQTGHLGGDGSRSRHQAADVFCPQPHYWYEDK